MERAYKQKMAGFAPGHHIGFCQFRQKAKPLNLVKSHQNRQKIQILKKVLFIPIFLG